MIADWGVTGELNNKLSQVRTYVGTDGKLHSVDGTGADTVLNFSSIKYANAYSTNTNWSTKIQTSERPHFILATQSSFGTCIYAAYSDGRYVPAMNSMLQAAINITDDGFQLRYTLDDGFSGNILWLVAYI